MPHGSFTPPGRPASCGHSGEGSVLTRRLGRQAFPTTDSGKPMQRPAAEFPFCVRLKWFVGTFRLGGEGLASPGAFLALSCLFLDAWATPLPTIIVNYTSLCLVGSLVWPFVPRRNSSSFGPVSRGDSRSYPQEPQRHTDVGEEMRGHQSSPGELFCAYLKLLDQRRALHFDFRRMACIGR